jgi:hypothetical protein
VSFGFAIFAWVLFLLAFDPKTIQKKEETLTPEDEPFCES